MLLIYKIRLKNQLNKKMKKLDEMKVMNMFCLIIIMLKNV